MLLQPRSAKRATRSAFTLLEVLVVVAIIVMLAGAGTYFLLPQLEEGKKGRAKTDVRKLSGLVDGYNVKHGRYPNSLEALTQPEGDDGPTCSREEIIDPWGKVYQMNPAGPHNSGVRADIFTTTPKGQVIGNFAQ
jgi:general secretion pathway protein G